MPEPAHVAPVLSPAQVRALLWAADVGTVSVARALATDETIPGGERRSLAFRIRSLNLAADELRRVLPPEGTP